MFVELCLALTFMQLKVSFESMTRSCPWSDQKQSLPDQVGDCLELSNALSTLHRTLSLVEVQDDPKLQVIEREDHFALAHFNLDLVIAIEVQLHEDLFDEGLVGDAIPQLHHLTVRLLAVEQLVEEV